MFSIPQFVHEVKEEYLSQHPDRKVEDLSVPCNEWIRLAFASSTPFNMVTGSNRNHNHVGKFILGHQMVVLHRTDLNYCTVRSDQAMPRSANENRAQAR